ncbi:glycosyltransferase family 2 protein [Sporosarcina limicola]|uniref:Glycosyltransferase involved in cell wall biosynthesis n=1 Tax=Sporosarcina limicola TaxID=34101 RepID=A0A927R305_9BACL|nr:glycosyltransferase family 2 protein [Sporosarcina limicola]MBE1553233.1 glycosyltransferase involved in cell wall biosynthesis [Sporosarcina limicola]
MDLLTISFIIPAHNEADNLENVMKAINEEMRQQHYAYEVIFIDDGSTDETIDVIRKLVFTFQEVKYVSFTRNFGKEAAILAGLQHATGAAVIIMDADLQHPAYMIPEFLKGFEEGYDQVVAKRNRKGDSRIRSALSVIYYSLINKTVDVQLTNGEGDFRLLSRIAVNALLQLSEGNRFSKGLYSWIGLEQKNISYENVVRGKGDSKWSFAALLNYGVDGIVSFNNKPLRLCFYMGSFILLLALFYIGTTFVQILKHGVDVPGYFTTISAVLFLGGVQLVSLGIIGEYIGRIYNETKKRPHYLIQQSNIEQVTEKREKNVIY